MSLAPGLSPVNTFRAEAALPGAGAYDAAPTVVHTAGAEEILLYCAYDEAAGGAAGSVGVIVEASPYSVDHATLLNWYRLSVVNVGAFAAGADVAEEVQREGAMDYEPTAATREGFILGAYGLKGAVARMRVSCAETGQVGFPGLMHVVGVMR